MRGEYLFISFKYIALSTIDPYPFIRSAFKAILQNWIPGVIAMPKHALLRQMRAQQLIWMVKWLASETGKEPPMAHSHKGGVFDSDVSILTLTGRAVKVRARVSGYQVHFGSRVHPGYFGMEFDAAYTGYAMANIVLEWLYNDIEKEELQEYLDQIDLNLYPAI